MDQARYSKLVYQAQSIVTEKAKDYQGKVRLEEYFPFGHKSYVQMIHVKNSRLVNLIEKESTTPKFESIKDTVLDMKRAAGNSRFTQLHTRARLVVPPGTDVARARALLEKAEQGCLVSNSLTASLHLECEVVEAA